MSKSSRGLRGDERKLPESQLTEADLNWLFLNAITWSGVVAR